MRAALASSLSSLVSVVSVASVASTILLCGCPDRTISEVVPTQGRVEGKVIPVKANRDVDILFLIDNSPSMGDKQTNLATNFPQFINVLSTIPGGLPNVHIGVATSDMGAKGAADGTPGNPIGRVGAGGCSGSGLGGALQLSGVMTNGDPFLSDIQPDDLTQPRVRNYTGDLATVFGQMARVGAGGCGFEQHLEGAKQALSLASMPGNANSNFLRKSAYLAVIFIADEDDCSMAHSSLIGNDNATLGPLFSFRCTRFGVTCDGGGATTDSMNAPGAKTNCHPNDKSAYLTDVADYATFFKGLKADPNLVIVAGIIGDVTPFGVDLEVPEGSTSNTKVPTLVHSCHYNGADGLEVADPAVRIKFFLDQFPNRNTQVSICQQDLSGGLSQIAELLKNSLGDPCIQGKLLDVDAKTPGDQFECAVAAETDPTVTPQTTKTIPRCNPDDGSGTTSACWHLVEDDVKCALTPDKLALKVEHEDTDSILNTNNAQIIASCVTDGTTNN